MLNLMEELTLLALDDETGKFIYSTSTALPIALIGSLIMELALAQKIAVDNKKIEILDLGPTGDDILDETLELISMSNKNKKIGYWLSKIRTKMKDLKQRILQRLIDKGILVLEEGKVLWIFNKKHYPTRYAEPENQVRMRIKSIVLNNEPADERSLYLLSLINSTDLVKEIFGKEDSKAAKKEIKKIVEGEKVGGAVTDSIQAEIATAVSIAVIGAVAATSASAS